MPNRRTTAITTAVLAAVTALLGGCGDTAGPGAASTTSPATTATPTPTTPPASPTQPTPNTTMTVPPPARDQAPPPTNATDYAREFVTAWASGNSGRGELLATPTAHKQAFASTPGAAPSFDGCEGAAGSAYCTFTGDEYTMVVRVSTQTASAGAPHAVTEVRFTH